GGRAGFDHFRQRLGLEDCDTLQLGSPFNFREQAELHLFRRMPDPASLPDAFEEAALEQIKDYVQRRAGWAFDLFTSHQALPQAVLKLKQGFGRLIRTKTDTGMVVILDPRVLLKGYWRTFLGALPECRRFIDGVPLEE